MNSQINNGYSKKIILLGIVIWSLAGLFFLYEFFIRASTGVLSGLLQHDLRVNAEEYSVVAAAYYLAYSAMQVPVGVLMDRFGVRVLLSIGALCCAFGCYLFSTATGMNMAWLGRFLMGLGSSVGFISLLTIALNWFPQRIFGFFAGMTQILGFIGPVLSGAPLAWMLERTHNDWRMIFAYVAYFGIALAIVLAFGVRSRNTPKMKGTAVPFLSHQIKQLSKRPQVLWIMGYAFFIYPAISLVGELWGVSYLKVRGFGSIEANTMIAALWLGLGLGSPLVGMLSDLLRRRRSVLLWCGLLGLAVSILFVWLPTQTAWIYDIILFLLGLAVGGQTLSFAILSENVPGSIKSTAMGCNNMAVMFGGMVIQVLAGHVLESTSIQGQYSLLNYQYTLSIMSAFFVMALLFGLGIKESHAKPLAE